MRNHVDEGFAVAWNEHLNRKMHLMAPCEPVKYKQFCKH